LLPDATNVVYVPSPLAGRAPGFVLFVRGLINTFTGAGGGTILAQPFDPKRLEFTGDAVPIAEQVRSFGASPAGVIAFRGARTQLSAQLTWYDRKGGVLSTAGEIGEYSDLALSPDQTRVAYERDTDLWIFDFTRGVNTKFTFGNPAREPAWSSDGSRIAFVSLRGGGYAIYQKASNLGGEEELLLQSPDLKAIPSWSHDGRFLMYTALGSAGKQGDLWILPVGGSAADRKPLSFLRTEFSEFGGQFSPDGRWVAYVSNQSGKNEVYVLPFDEANPGSPAPGGLHQVSQDGGHDPHWSGDGKDLFYLAPDGYFMSVNVNAAGGTFQTGAPQQLFRSPARSEGWDVAADGNRFLIAAPSGSGAAASPSYHVVVNWTELLKR
jgi:hypothetical protein